MFAGQRRRSSNVRAMQLFHELKQQFPTIPDQIVTSCISSYVQSNAQGKKPNLIQLIETAIADNKLEQMGRLETPQSVEEQRSSSGDTCSEEAAPESVEVSTKADPQQPEEARADMNESASDFNKNLVQEPPRTTAAKRPNQLDIRSDTLPGFQQVEKRQFNIQLSEKCKDIHKLLNSSISDKPPRSPIGAKRVLAKNSPTRVERSSLLSPEKRTEEPASSELQRRLGSQESSSSSPQGALIKKETCSTPTQTTDTLLGSPNVNVSLNVNCSVDVAPSRRSVSSSWADTPTTSSPRNITSVNFTVSPPASSGPQNSPTTSGVTYSTSNFDPQKRVQSRLQITVGPGGGNLSSFKVRPRSFHLPETTQEVVPVRAAGSLNDLVKSSEPPVILKQQARLERLRAELNNEKAKLEAVKKEVAELEKNRLERQLADDNLMKKLLSDIKHLRYQCKELQSDGEAFYRNIYTGQRGPLTIDVPQPRPLRQSTNRPRLQYQGPSLFRQSTDEEGPKWNCGICTFLNHPDLDKCEQCDMPRIVHGTNAEAAVDPLKLLKATRSLSLIPIPSNNNNTVLTRDAQSYLRPPRIVISSRSTPNMFGHNNLS